MSGDKGEGGGCTTEKRGKKGALSVRAGKEKPYCRGRGERQRPERPYGAKSAAVGIKSDPVSSRRELFQEERPNPLLRTKGGDKVGEKEGRSTIASSARKKVFETDKGGGGQKTV